MKKPRTYGLRVKDAPRTFEMIKRIIDADTLRALEDIARADRRRKEMR